MRCIFDFRTTNNNMDNALCENSFFISVQNMKHGTAQPGRAGHKVDYTKLMVRSRQPVTRVFPTFCVELHVPRHFYGQKVGKTRVTSCLERTISI